MNSTALGAESIIFISEAHEKFYYEKLKEVRYQDVYHKALCYCLGINDDTRRNANRIYDFKTGCVKTECLHEGWQTSGSVKVVRMAFNLYCNAAPSVDDYTDAEEQINECRQYTVEELFCCAYAPYFWQAIQIRYPEYATYNRKLYALFGGADWCKPFAQEAELAEKLERLSALNALLNMDEKGNDGIDMDDEPEAPKSEKEVADRPAKNIPLAEKTVGTEQDKGIRQYADAPAERVSLKVKLEAMKAKVAVGDSEKLIPQKAKGKEETL